MPGRHSVSLLGLGLQFLAGTITCITGLFICAIMQASTAFMCAKHAASGLQDVARHCGRQPVKLLHVGGCRLHVCSCNTVSICDDGHLIVRNKMRTRLIELVSFRPMLRSSQGFACLHMAAGMLQHLLASLLHMLCFSRMSTGHVDY